jgi:SAM-dependent methyltransferase
LAVLVCFSLITNYGQKQLEGFTEKTNEFKMNDDLSQIYDGFYVDIYDDLVFSKIKNDFEIGKIIEYTKPAEKSIILDIGSGTGHHVSSFAAKGYKATGIDISPSMIKKAKENYPKLNFKLGDALDSMVFAGGEFTHITCLYFTIYYIKNKRKLFDNCMRWLMPGGFLALHTVNRDKFDPILPAGSPFGIISPQNYTKKRITSTTVKFDEFEYKSNFVLKDKIKKANDPNAIMVETFKNNKNGNVRRNEHKLYMLTQAEILDIAKAAGFIVHSKIDLLQCQYANQYVYILEKPT